jgi:hypothetical protein
VTGLRCHGVETLSRRCSICACLFFKTKTFKSMASSQSPSVSPPPRHSLSPSPSPPIYPLKSELRDSTSQSPPMTTLIAHPQASLGSAGVNKRYRPAPAKTFQCRGYGECRMVFSRSEHLARHIRYASFPPFSWCLSLTVTPATSQ